MVGLRLHVEPFGPALSLLIEGTCALGIVADVPAIPADFERHPVGRGVEILPVAAAGHPLASEPGPLGRDLLREHVQLVLTDKSGLTRGRDYRVMSARTWRLADLGAKHAMLLAGLGWGYMPTHLVTGDIAEGRLVELTLAAGLDGARANLPMIILHRRSTVLGPAGRWLMARIAAPPETAG
jgi:DNA-binding transcriptional LysR family regulator